MKYGFHIYLFTERWDDNSLDILDAARDLEAQCVDIAVGDDVIFNPAKTRKRAESLGLELTISPGGLWPVECDVSSDDPAERRRGIEWLKKYVDQAEALGAKAFSGSLYGHPGTVKRRVPPSDEYARTAEGLREVAEYGERRGVEIVLEPMSHFRTHLVNTPEQAARLIRLADHRNLSILLDTYHMITEVRDFGAAFRSAGDLLWGVHACENDRGRPGGGVVPWDAVFGALAENHFDGYMVLESYNSALGDFAWRRGMFHNVCPDAESFVRKGFAFLRELEARHAK